MINFNDIGSWHFVSELDVIEVTSIGNVEVRITAADGAVLLSGTYIPVDGMVRVYHLHKLLSPLIMEVSATFTITVGDVSKTVHVVQSRIAVTETAADFLPSFFLTTVMTERDTALGRKELLTLLPIEATVPDVVAVALYWNGTQVVTASHTLASGLTTGAVTEVDVSSAGGHYPWHTGGLHCDLWRAPRLLSRAEAAHCRGGNAHAQRLRCMGGGVLLRHDRARTRVHPRDGTGERQPAIV